MPYPARCSPRVFSGPCSKEEERALVDLKALGKTFADIGIRQDAGDLIDPETLCSKYSLCHFR
jgi:hypothetical protein